MDDKLSQWANQKGAARDRTLFEEALPRMTLAALGEEIRKAALLMGLNWGKKEVCDLHQATIEACIAELRRRDSIR